MALSIITTIINICFVDLLVLLLLLLLLSLLLLLLLIRGSQTDPTQMMGSAVFWAASEFVGLFVGFPVASLPGACPPLARLAVSPGCLVVSPGACN